MQSDMLRLRHRIYKQFPDSSDLDAFLIDFFPHVYANTGRGMTCVALVNHLFLSESRNVDAITKALDGIAAKDPATSPRRALRMRIEQQCPTSDDLDALLMDHFIEVYRRLAPGMSTIAKINMLLVHIDIEQIHAALLARSSHSAAISAHPGATPATGVAAPPSAVTPPPRPISVSRTVPVVQNSAAPNQPLSLTGSSGVGPENKLVHVTLLDKDAKDFDLLDWEQPYPERFTRLKFDPDDRLLHLLSFSRSRSGLTIKAMPTLLINADSHLQQAAVTVRPADQNSKSPIHQVYWYCPGGKQGGVRYLLRIVGEPESQPALQVDSPCGWRWTIELVDKEELPHLYLRFIWGQ